MNYIGSLNKKNVSHTTTNHVVIDCEVYNPAVHFPEIPWNFHGISMEKGLRKYSGVFGLLSGVTSGTTRKNSAEKALDKPLDFPWNVQSFPWKVWNNVQRFILDIFPDFPWKPLEILWKPAETSGVFGLVFRNLWTFFPDFPQLFPGPFGG